MRRCFSSAQRRCFSAAQRRGFSAAQRRDFAAGAQRRGPLALFQRRVQNGWRADSRQEAVAVLLQRAFDSKRRGGTGLYLHGSVGSGKTALMDLFVESCNASGVNVQRLHFHELMRVAHAGLHLGDGSPAQLGDRIGRQSEIIALDEIQITDIADAAIVSRLLEGMCKAGITLIATSNRAPSELYQGGLNRHVYIPQLVRVLEEYGVESHRLVAEGEADYRRLRPSAPDSESPAAAAARPLDRRFFRMMGDDADAALVAAVSDSCEAAGGQTPAALPLGPSRALRVPHYDAGAAAAVLSFEQLCGARAPLGPQDYLALSRSLDAIAISGVPALTPRQHNEARRFITFLDVWCEGGPHPRRLHSHSMPRTLLTAARAARGLQVRCGQGAVRRGRLPAGRDLRAAGSGRAEKRHLVGRDG